MTDFPFQIMGFDLDGTLFDTSFELTASVNHALATVDRPPVEVAAVRGFIGEGARAMLAMALSATGGGGDAMVDTLYPVLIDHYAAHLGTYCPPFPGLLDALDALAARGVACAVVTNKMERLAVGLIEALGMTDRFACIIGGDTTPHRKPAREMVDAMIVRCGGVVGQTPAVLIGDSRFDVGAAKAAGIASVAVSFGFLRGPVAELGADASIDHYDELVPLLSGWNRRAAI